VASEVLLGWVMPLAADGSSKQAALDVLSGMWQGMHVNIHWVVLGRLTN
jgi:hypothetical protein